MQLGNALASFEMPVDNYFYFPLNKVSSIDTRGFGRDSNPIMWQVPNSTDTRDINEQNKIDLKKLDEQSSMFVNLLIHVDFEDGYTNDAIVFVENKMKTNAFAVCLWLNKIYMQYATSKELDENRIIVTGVLRIIAYLNQTKDFAVIMPAFYAMIRASVLCDDIAEQEAALMVIESWRNKEFLSILEESIEHIRDASLKEYAAKLQSEISDELKKAGANVT